MVDWKHREQVDYRVRQVLWTAFTLWAVQMLPSRGLSDFEAHREYTEGFLSRHSLAILHFLVLKNGG